MSAHHRPLDESDVTLIHTIRSTPSLYDHRHEDFRLSQRKEEDWAKVADTLKISASDARRRWTCLRDRYSRELKQMRLHPASDFGKNEFFRQMDFLREFVRKRRERSRRDDTPTSWLKSEVKKPRLIARPKPEILLDPDLDDSQNYEESEHNFDADTKLEVQTTQSESYSVLAEADEVDADEHVSYDDYLADTETAQQKPLPTLRPSPALVTVHTEAPTTTTTTSTTVADRSSSETEHTHADLNYMVCLPNMSVEREHLPAIKSDALSSFETISTPVVAHNETEDDFFCKSVAAYLRQLSRRHKIKAKVEMYQILEKYILIEEAAATTTTIQGSGSHN